MHEVKHTIDVEAARLRSPLREMGPMLAALLDLAAAEARRLVSQELWALGYTYVTLDLDGFRSGSLNKQGRG